MIDWNKEAEKIFNDPLLADITAPRKPTTSEDLQIAVFQAVRSFYLINGRLPEDGNPDETSLYHKWVGLLKKEERIERCRPFDDLGILPQPVQAAEEPQPVYQRELTEEEQLEAIFNDPLLADAGTGADAGLFDLPDYMRQRLNARKEAEYIGKRRPCEDFDKYADGFKEIQKGLKSGKCRLIKFSVKHLKVGCYFVDNGIIGYLAAFDDEGVNQHGERDGRTRVIYENGSEADIKYKTITKNLSVTGYSVVDHSGMNDEEFEKRLTISEKDVESGTVYVLRSKSTLPEIASIKDLYKIGFTAVSVESRIANAKNEPTYLCADVEVVATWKVYNVKASTFEALIHKLFAGVQLQITVDKHQPKEWFIVPFYIIEQAVNYIIMGKSVMYDARLKQLVVLGSSANDR